MEEWKDITGYEGIYQISNLGRVKRKKRTFIKANNVEITYPEKEKKPQLNKNGYLQVMLIKDDKYKLFYVHKLVAEHFCYNPLTDDFIVTHINKKKTDNRFFNLRFISKYTAVNKKLNLI